MKYLKMFFRLLNDSIAIEFTLLNGEPEKRMYHVYK